MSDETAPQPRIKITWLIGTMAAFALFVVIGAYSARMTWTYSDYDQDRAKVRKATLADVQKAEKALLYPAVDAQGQPHAEWVDQAKGTIRLPIEEAMGKELDTLKAQPVAMGAEIPVAAPTPAAPAPSTGATNAAPVTPVAPAAKGAAKPTHAGSTAAAAAPAKPNPSNK